MDYSRELMERLQEYNEKKEDKNNTKKQRAEMDEIRKSSKEINRIFEATVDDGEDR